MSWWNRTPGEERTQWVLDPLVGVGPLRFGMSPEEVGAALGGAAARVWRGRASGATSQEYRELIARVPSEVRADLHELARQDGVSVRVNR